MSKLNLFKGVDLQTPDAFLTEITDTQFFDAVSNTPEATPEPPAGNNIGGNPSAGQYGANFRPYSADGQPAAPFSMDGQTSVMANQFINGKTGVAIIEVIIPLLLTYCLLWFANKKVKKSAFQLSASEKATIEPLVDACLATMNINFNNPWIALAVVGMTMYGAKFIEVATDESIPKIEVEKNADGTPVMNAKKSGRGRPVGSVKKSA